MLTSPELREVVLSRIELGKGQWITSDRGIERVAGDAAPSPCVEVLARSGHRIVAGPTTAIAAARSGRLIGYLAAELEVGDYVVVAYGGVWPDRSPDAAPFLPSRSCGRQKAVELPTAMSDELAFFLGAYVSEGHLNRSNWSVVVTNSVPKVLERVADCVARCFGLTARVVYPAHRCSYVVVASKTLVEWLEHLGCGARSQEKRVPAWILGSSWPHVAAFLEGLWLDAYTAWMGKTPKWGLSVASPGLLDDVQAILTNLGVPHGWVWKRDHVTGNRFGELYAVGEPAQRLIRAVPFAEPEKRRRAEERLQATPSQSTSDVVPIIEPRQLAELIPRAPRGQRSRTPFGFLRDPGTKHVSLRTLERVAELPGVRLPTQLIWLLETGGRLVPISDVVHRTSLMTAVDTEGMQSVGGIVLAERLPRRTKVNTPGDGPSGW